MLDKAERLQRQFFHHAAASWEPPVDITESADEVQVQVALPGVPIDSITLTLDPAGLTVAAARPFPCGGETRNIHRDRDCQPGERPEGGDRAQRRARACVERWVRRGRSCGWQIRPSPGTPNPAGAR